VVYVYRVLTLVVHDELQRAILASNTYRIQDPPNIIVRDRKDVFPRLAQLVEVRKRVYRLV
jgi:hypothetical protein